MCRHSSLWEAIISRLGAVVFNTLELAGIERLRISKRHPAAEFHVLDLAGGIGYRGRCPDLWTSKTRFKKEINGAGAHFSSPACFHHNPR
jgi:hypothetical protein